MTISDVGGQLTTPTVKPANAKDSLASDLVIVPSLDETESEFTVHVEIRNQGAKRSDPATLRAVLLTLVADEETTAPDDRTISVVESDDDILPAIDPKGAPLEFGWTTPHDDLDPGRTYFVAFEVLDGLGGLQNADVLARGFTGRQLAYRSL